MYMFRNQKIPLKRCEYFVQSVLRGMNWQESAEGEIHVTKLEKYMLSNQKNTAKKMEVLLLSDVRRMNQHEGGIHVTKSVKYIQ